MEASLIAPSPELEFPYLLETVGEKLEGGTFHPRRQTFHPRLKCPPYNLSWAKVSGGHFRLLHRH